MSVLHEAMMHSSLHPPDGQGITPLVRVCRSLVNWHEIPARVMLARGDRIRFAHAMATISRQVLLAQENLERAGVTSPQIAVSERFDGLFRLDRPDQAADCAEAVIGDMLAELRRCGIPESDTSLGLWNDIAADSCATQETVRSIALAVFERTQSIGAVAVAVADSWARGYADSASDIDVRLIVKDMPSLGDRAANLRDLAARPSFRQYGDEAYITADQFVALDQKVDVKYHPMNQVRAAVCTPFTLGGPIDLLELVQEHAPVADPARVFFELQTAYTAHRVSRTLEIARTSLFAAQSITETACAGDAASDYASTMLGPGLEYVARGWAGINGRVYAFPKWLNRLAPQFDHGPAGGLDRLTEICSADWTGASGVQAAYEWKSFVADLCSLMKRIDTGTAR